MSASTPKPVACQIETTDKRGTRRCRRPSTHFNEHGFCFCCYHATMIPEFKLTPFTEDELKSANQPTHMDLLIDAGNALHDQIGCGCNAFFPCAKCKEAMERWDELTTEKGVE